MSTSSVAASNDQKPKPDDLLTIEELNAAHNNLMRDQTPDLSAEKFDEFVECVNRFLHQGRAVGVSLSGLQERIRIQAILDYWVATLHRMKRPVSDDITLEEYDPERAPQLSEEDRPYVGMRPFNMEEGELFFGRNAEVQSMLELLEAHHFVGVVGFSGSGKSSLVMGGLIHQLRQGKIHDEWWIKRLVPGRDPLRALAHLFLPNANEDAECWREKQIAELRGNPSHLLKLLNEETKLSTLLFVDQFEEVFALCDSLDDRKSFIDNLVNVVTSTSCHYVVLTIRSEYRERIAQHDNLDDLIHESRSDLEALTKKELYAVIEEPARKKLEFEPGVVSALVRDILGQPMGLPLLQFTLMKLWKERQGNKITRAAYQKLGNARLALQEYADEFMKNLPSEDRKRVRTIFLRIVRTGEDVSPTTSNRAPRKTLYQEDAPKERAEIDRLVAKLVDEGLLRLNKSTLDPNDDQVEVTHEALVTSWPTLLGWIEKDRDALKMRRKLENDLAQWKEFVERGQKEGGLLDPFQLRLAQEWVASEDAKVLGFDPALYDFLKTSKELNDKIETDKHEARQREIVTERRRAIQAEQSAKIASSHRLAFRALLVSDTVVDTALLLGLQACKTYRTDEAIAAILTTLGKNPHLKAYLRGHANMVYSVACSPDGRMLASADRDGCILFWDSVEMARIGEAVRDQDDQRRETDVLAFSPDGTMLASSDRDGNITLWDVAKRKRKSQFKVCNEAIYALAWSANGKLLACGDGNGGVSLWRSDNGEIEFWLFQPPSKISEVTGLTFIENDAILAVVGGDREKTLSLWNLTTHNRTYSSRDDYPGEVFSAAGHPGGGYLAVGCQNGDILLFDITAPQPRLLGKPISGHKSKIWSLAFRRPTEEWNNENLLVSSSQDGTLRLWSITEEVDQTAALPEAPVSKDRDVTVQQIGWPLVGHNNEVNSLKFLPDGKTVVSGGDDNNLILWDLTNPRPLVGHKGGVLTLDVSDNGRLWASGDRTGVVRLWDAVTGRAAAEPIVVHSDQVLAVAFSPDNKFLVVGGQHGVLRMYDIEKNYAMRPLRNPDPVKRSHVFRIVYNPQNPNMFASGSRTGRIRIWNAATGEYRNLAEPAEGTTIWGLRFTPDGKKLVSGDRSGQIRIWDVASGACQTLGKEQSGHTGDVLSVAISPDGNTLVSGGSDGTIRVWDMKEPYPQGQLLGKHNSFVTSLALNKSGTQLASGSRDSIVALWELPKGEKNWMKARPLVLRYRGHQGTVNSVRFSHDGHRLLSGGDDRLIFVWQTQFSDWADRPCAIARRNLTHEEWNEYVVFEDINGSPYEQTCPEYD